MRRLLAVMWLSGCSAVAPLPDAGVPPVDSGSTFDAGGGVLDSGIDAGTDAGPAEPTLGSSVLYREDFETYADVSALKSGYPIFREQGATLDLDLDAGSKAMRIDYATDGGCADAEVFVGKLVAGDLPEVIASWRFRLETGFLYVQPASHCAAMGTGATEFVITRPGDPSGRISLEVSEAAGWLVRVEGTAFAQQLRTDSHGPLALSQGSWHRVTFAISRESGVGSTDGVVRVWIDGAVVIDREGVATGTAPFNAIRYPTSLKAGASRAQSRWVDDVVLFAR